MNTDPARLKILLIGAVFLGFFCAASVAVTVSEQDIVIPTYLSGAPDPDPMFYFGLSSQGAAGRVYPYPLYDSLTNTKSNKVYRIVYLENQYVRIGVLPEIGGRLFEAIDKSNGYNFIYRQHVIKPALIGLIGAWISGGIEWNIPHHHRATTFLPVQYRIESNPDASKTIWVGELELRQRMRWAVGYTLRPGKSYLECSVRILNRAPLVNTMLCFANVAVRVNENYQVIYPPSTRFVTFHGKREFTTWPVATTRYAGADFTRGVDVSWYSNHISANSMFAWNYQDDFFAGYDHGRQAGILSVADHHIIPGKKFWTWGNGPRGRMWEKILTDSDGPYIELMAGAYSDNQPDYSWLQPYETKSFKMYWYPFRGIGGVKNANLDAAINLDVATNGAVTVGFCTTTAYPAATVRVKAGDTILLEQSTPIDPGRPYTKHLSIPLGIDEHDLRASLSVAGKELVSYSPLRLEPQKMPEPVTGPPPPEEMKSVEELFLAGQRIEQFHSPSLQPEPYWEEALRRDPGDSRVNTALGIRKLKQARFAEAEQLFRKALERLTFNYTAPKDGEASYYLGLALEGQDRFNEAFDAFYKATWSAAWEGPAYFALAEIATRRGDLDKGMEFVNRALDFNALNLRALNLKASLLRHARRSKQALALLDAAAAKTDPLDVRLATERWLAGDKKASSFLNATLLQHPATGLETAAEYADAGLWHDGIEVLTQMVNTARQPERVSPLAWYYLGDFAERLGNVSQAAEYRHRAAIAPPDYVFPFQVEMLPVLRRAIAVNPQDPRAPYYLGNLLFDWQPDEAVRLWKQSAKLDPGFSMVHRNLALAYWRQHPANLPAAIAELEQAVAAPSRTAMQFEELDELYALTGMAPEKRLALLQQNHSVVAKRDDALSREIGLRIFSGQYDAAIRFMTGRKFSVWEGGSLDVAQHWVNAHLLRGRQSLRANRPQAALDDFEVAGNIPENLPSEREIGRTAEMAYWKGLACDMAGNTAKARQFWNEAAAENTNGQHRTRRGLAGSQIEEYFQALAELKLGRQSEGERALKSLLERAGQSFEKSNGIPETAPSVRTPDAQSASAHYLAGLAQLSLGQIKQARTQFDLALRCSPDLLGARAELDSLR